MWTARYSALIGLQAPESDDLFLGESALFTSVIPWQAVEKSSAGARGGRYDLKSSKNEPDEKDEREADSVVCNAECPLRPALNGGFGPRQRELDLWSS